MTGTTKWYLRLGNLQHLMECFYASVQKVKMVVKPCGQLSRFRPEKVVNALPAGISTLFYSSGRIVLRCCFFFCWHEGIGIHRLRPDHARYLGISMHRHWHYIDCRYAIGMIINGNFDVPDVLGRFCSCA